MAMTTAGPNAIGDLGDDWTEALRGADLPQVRPLLVGSTTPNAIQQEAGRLAEAYRTGGVLLTAPSAGLVAAVAEAIGLDAGALDPGCGQGAMAVMVQRGSHGIVRRRFAAPVLTGRTAKLSEAAPRRGGGGAPDSTDWRPLTIASTPALETATRAAVIKGLDTGLPAPSAAAAARLVGDPPSPGILYQDDQWITDIQNFPLPVQGNNSNTIPNYFQVTTIILPACQLETNTGILTDYYFVIQAGVFNPSNGYIADGDGNWGWYVDWYNMNCYPTDYAGQTTVPMLQSTPPTTSQMATQSSSLSYNIGGSVGFFGGGGMATITAGASYSNTTTITVVDVTIANNANSQINNAQWDFTMPYANQDGFSGTVLASHSAFEPYNQFFFTMPTSARGSNPTFSLSSELQLQYVWSPSDDAPTVYQPTPPTWTSQAKYPPQPTST